MLSWLLYNTLCALPIALVALVARRALRGTPAVEHALWLLVLVRLVLPPLGPLAATSVASAPPIVASGEPGLADVLVARATRVLGPQWSDRAADVLLAAFLVVLAAAALRELVRARAVERCVRRARPADPLLARRVRRVAAELGVRAPAVVVSCEAPGPFLWSLRRPVLVLPEGAAPERTVLAHELAHLARRDHWTARLELVAQAFHAWNPLFRLARRNLRRAAELAADQWVVRRFPGERRAFATALVGVAERAGPRAASPRAVQALGMDARDFEERLVRILRSEARPRARLAALAVLAALPTLPGLAVPTLADFRAALVLPAGIDLETWRRSLAAADARLAAAPDDGDAYLRRGMAHLGLGRAAKALADFTRQEELGHRVGAARYNQACAHVRLGDPDAALACLRGARDAGMDVAAYVREDPDLAPLRDHPGLAELLAQQPGPGG